MDTSNGEDLKDKVGGYIIRELRNLMKLGDESCDIEIEALDNTSFKVHSVLLAAIWKDFRSWRSRHANDNKLTFAGVSGKDLRLIVLLMYGICSRLESDNLSLHRALKRLEINGLLKIHSEAITCGLHRPKSKWSTTSFIHRPDSEASHIDVLEVETQPSNLTQDFLGEFTLKKEADATPASSGEFNYDDFIYDDTHSHDFNLGNGNSNYSQLGDCLSVEISEHCSDIPENVVQATTTMACQSQANRNQFLPQKNPYHLDGSEITSDQGVSEVHFPAKNKNSQTKRKSVDNKKKNGAREISKKPRICRAIQPKSRVSDINLQLSTLAETGCTPSITLPELSTNVITSISTNKIPIFINHPVLNTTSSPVHRRERQDDSVSLINGSSLNEGNVHDSHLPKRYISTVRSSASGINICGVPITPSTHLSTNTNDSQIIEKRTNSKIRSELQPIVKSRIDIEKITSTKTHALSKESTRKMPIKSAKKKRTILPRAQRAKQTAVPIQQPGKPYIPIVCNLNTTGLRFPMKIMAFSPTDSRSAESVTKTHGGYLGNTLDLHHNTKVSAIPAPQVLHGNATVSTSTGLNAVQHESEVKSSTSQNVRDKNYLESHDENTVSKVNSLKLAKEVNFTEGTIGASGFRATRSPNGCDSQRLKVKMVLPKVSNKSLRIRTACNDSTNENTLHESHSDPKDLSTPILNGTMQSTMSRRYSIGSCGSGTDFLSLGQNQCVKSPKTGYHPRRKSLGNDLSMNPGNSHPVRNVQMNKQFRKLQIIAKQLDFTSTEYKYSDEDQNLSDECDARQSVCNSSDAIHPVLCLEQNPEENTSAQIATSTIDRNNGVTVKTAEKLGGDNENLIKSRHFGDFKSDIETVAPVSSFPEDDQRKDNYQAVRNELKTSSFIPTEVVVSPCSNGNDIKISMVLPGDVEDVEKFTKSRISRSLNENEPEMN